MSSWRGAQLRKAVLVAASTLVFLLLPVVAGAAEPDSLTARQRYLAGAQAYAAGKYAEAVDQFIAADRIAPSSALSFDIARSYEKLGESSLALRWFRDYLHRAGDAPDGQKVRRIVASFERELHDKGIQQVTVRSVPRGATVTVDGDPAGVTPWTSDLPPGRHRLSLVYDGYERSERWFVLPPDHAIDVDVSLGREKPKPAVVAPSAAAPAVAAAAPPPSKEPAPAQSAVPSAAIAPVSTPEPTSSGSSGVRTAGIVTMSVGAAALGGALTFEILRRQSENDAKKDPTQAGYASKISQADDRQMAARVLLGVGAGLVVTGGVMFFVGGPSEHRTEIALGCLPGACGASASGRF
jgi:tetratricopeptide (TPR) repeat protein